MGYAQKRLGRDGKPRYTAVYFDVRGDRRSAGTYATKKEANEKWQDAEAKAREGRGVNLRAGTRRFGKYVEETWFPNHRIELTTRQRYRSNLDQHILPEFGNMRMRDILPEHVRDFVNKLERKNVGAPTIASVKSVLSAIFTTALNDQMIFLHPCKGVKTPVVTRREYTIITPEQFDRLYHALPSDELRLMVETAIESGMRWGELAELRAKDLDIASRIVTVRRVVVEVARRYRTDGRLFQVKQYPKNQKSRRFKLGPEVVARLDAHIKANKLEPDDLLFPLRQDDEQPIPEIPDPDTLGRTEPNAKGRTYKHGTLTAYQLGKCKCEYCRGAYARYRAERRSAGKDDPRTKRRRETDGHIPRDWWYRKVWQPALKEAKIGTKIRPHDLRHSHASWLLSGGADLQVVKDRLGHGSLRTTERYLHTLPEADDTAVDAFTKIRNRSKPGAAS